MAHAWVQVMINKDKLWHRHVSIVDLIEKTRNAITCLCFLQPESQEMISHSQLTSDYPRYPSVFKAIKGLTPADRLMFMVHYCTLHHLDTEYKWSLLQDLSLYMNPCPYTISHEAPLPQVFNLFRTMGLLKAPTSHSGIGNCEWKMPRCNCH